jgi:hypothetical protein
MQLAHHHPLAFAGRRRPRPSHLAAPPPPLPPLPATTTGGGQGGSASPDDDAAALEAAAAYERRRREAEAEALAELGARDLTRRSRREAEAARQALATLLGGAGSRAFRAAAAGAVAPQQETQQEQQQPQQQPRFAYSREAPPGTSTATTPTPTPPLPYGTSSATERLVALNAPAYYMSAQAAMPAEERAAAREAARAAKEAAKEAARAAKRRARAEAEAADAAAAAAAAGDQSGAPPRRRKRLKVDPVEFMGQVRMLQSRRLAEAADASAREGKPLPGLGSKRDELPGGGRRLSLEAAAFWEAAEALLEYQRRLDEEEEDETDFDDDEDHDDEGSRDLRRALRSVPGAGGSKKDGEDGDEDGDRSWEGDALGDAKAGRQSSSNPRDAIRLLLDHSADGLGRKGGPAAPAADPADENLEAAARLPTTAPAAAAAEERAAARRERMFTASLEAAAFGDEEAAKAAASRYGPLAGGPGGAAAAAAAAAALQARGGAGAAPERLRVALADMTRRARRQTAADAEVRRRADAAAGRLRPGHVHVDGPYDPIRDIWEADKWHPRRKLWSPVPTEAPRSGPLATSRDVRNPYAPQYFRFQAVASTLSRGLEALLGPSTDEQHRDPSLRPRAPGAPWKALPRALASETAPSPVERLASAAAALLLRGEGGRAVVHSEAMRADTRMADEGPLLPKTVVLRSKEAIEEALLWGGDRRAGVAGGGGVGGQAATVAAAAGSAAPAAAAAGAEEAADATAAPPAATASTTTTTPPIRRLPKTLRATTPGRLLSKLASAGAPFQFRPNPRAARARLMLESGGLSPDDALPFAYSAGYEYVQYSSWDRLAQLLLASAYLAAAAAVLSYVYFTLSQGLALALALTWGLGTLSLPKAVLLFALAAGGKAWLYPAWLAFCAADRLVGWMGERLQGFFRAQAIVWVAYLVLSPAHWHPLPFPWIPVTGS